MDETYYQALAFCQKSTREDGIDAALQQNGTQLSALLVPPEVGQTYQIAAQAGKFQNSASISHNLVKFSFSVKRFPLTISSFHNLDVEQIQHILASSSSFLSRMIHPGNSVNTIFFHKKAIRF